MGALALCSLVKKFCVSSPWKGFRFYEVYVRQNVAARKKIDQSSLLIFLYLCAPWGWNDRYRSYSTSSDTVSGIRRIDPGAMLFWYAVHTTGMAYRKPMSIFPPRLYMRWREDVCSLVRNYRNLNYLERLSTPMSRTRVPTYTLGLNCTRLRRCRGFRIECSVFNFFHPLPPSRSSFFFCVEHISLSSSTGSTKNLPCYANRILS